MSDGTTLWFITRTAPIQTLHLPTAGLVHQCKSVATGGSPLIPRLGDADGVCVTEVLTGISNNAIVRYSPLTGGGFVEVYPQC